MQHFANSPYWECSYLPASRGLSPHQYELAPGTVLYRFIDLNKGPSIRQADGPWWFEYQYFQNIKHFGQRYGYTMGYTARLFAAIFYEWSEVNAYVRARVQVPLLAWKGKGKQVEVQGRDPRDVVTPHGFLTETTPRLTPVMTPMQGPWEVLQLYIPGLGWPHHQFSSFLKLIDGPEHIRSEAPHF